MAVVSPPPITALPAAPDRADRATFSARATAMFTALKDVFVGQVGAVAANVAANATDAATSATNANSSAAAASTSESNAATSAAAAGTAAGAPVWVSGTTYAFGNAVWSPSNRLIYRRIVAGAGTTDPSADATNWALLGTLGLTVITVSGTTQTAVKGNHYVLTNVAASTVTLPASAASGDQVWVTVANGLTTNIIARNGLTIESLAQDMTIDSVTTVKLAYLNSTWRII